jgi:hypothetical protein
MKKILPIAAVLLVAMLVWSALAHQHDLHIMFNGEELETPFDFLVGLMAAGTGLAIAVLVMLVVGAVLAVVFASVGTVVLGALCAAALAVLLAVAPVVLLAVIPIWLVYKLVTRAKPARGVPAERTEPAYDAKPAR